MNNVLCTPNLTTEDQLVWLNQWILYSGELCEIYAEYDYIVTALEVNTNILEIMISFLKINNYFN